MECPSLRQLLEAMERKGYRVFAGAKGHDLNIVGVRTADNRANTFNDWVTVFYKQNGVWNFFAFPATTDPGTYYRKNPQNVRGTAVMKPGRYPGAYKVGIHAGYKALQQKGNITVYRDNNKDEVIDTTGMVEDTGIHAVNIHRANRVRASTQVDKWSAGCQVLQDPDHFDFLMALCDRAVENWDNSFTYTLLEERDIS